MTTIIHDAKSGGRISGFPSPNIRANWPTTVKGKRLTDARIRHYEKLGYYGGNGILALQKLEAHAKAQKKAKVNQLKRLLKIYV